MRHGKDSVEGVQVGTKMLGGSLGVWACCVFLSMVAEFPGGFGCLNVLSGKDMSGQGSASSLAARVVTEHRCLCLLGDEFRLLRHAGPYEFLGLRGVADSGRMVT